MNTLANDPRILMTHPRKRTGKNPPSAVTPLIAFQRGPIHRIPKIQPLETNGPENFQPLDNTATDLFQRLELKLGARDSMCNFPPP